MKTKNAASRPIPTAAQLKKQRVRRVSCIILRILLVLSTILFTWITCWGCGLGWISRARAGSNWPMSFVGYGQMLLVGSGLLTLGTVLVLLCRKNWLNWAAAGSAAGGVVLCLLALYHVASYAKEHSFYSQLMQMPAGDAVLRTDPAGASALCHCVSGLRDCYSFFRPRRYSAAVPENWRIRQKRRPFSERPERPVWFFSAFYTDFTKIISFSTSFSLAVLQRMW